MILPIYAYGQPALRQRADEVEADNAELQHLIDDMVETMIGATGIGLAAPQVGHRLRLVVVDASAMDEDLEAGSGRALVLINPQVELDDAGDRVEYEEGCLSIPDIRETVVRPDRLRVRFLDRDFQPQELEAEGMLARVIQHEMDHLDGVLFVDRVSPLRKRLLGRRLRAIARGETEADYALLLAGATSPTLPAESNPAARAA